MQRKRRLILLTLGLFLAMFAAGCKKKAPPPPPPPPPPAPAVVQRETPAPAPTANFTAEPNSIERGQTATLRWTTANATDASIDHGIGSVGTSGTRQVSPAESTTYALIATGPGGTGRATASITVRAAPPPPPPPARSSSFDVDLATRVQDAYFDYDKFDIRADAQTVLTADASALKDLLGTFATARVVIEGHCDERGSAEYNLALGDRRANSAKEFLQQLGIPADKLSVISYGKERPQCTQQAEECWQRNRRVHFTAGS